jgi:ATP-dependent Clp protease adaptor protein ClpS
MTIIDVTVLPDVLPETDVGTETPVKRQPPYNVILLNDDDHSVDYVVAMMTQLFGHPKVKGVQIAKEVHFQGRCIVKTCSKELAELKQEQIHAFGPDPLIPRCKGSMSSVIEPAA